MAAFSPSHIRRKRAGGIFRANGGGGDRAPREAVCATSRQLRNDDGPGRLAPCCGYGSRHQRPHEMESAMTRPFILAIVIGVAAFGPAGAQGINSASTTPGGSPSQTATPGQGRTDPAFIPQGPCSVSSNATGGVTTSSSCGTDPLQVPALTLSSSSSPAQVSGGTTRSTQSTSGSSSSTTSTATSNAGGGGAPSSSTTLCSSSVPSTSGSISTGSLAGGIAGGGC